MSAWIRIPPIVMEAECEPVAQRRFTRFGFWLVVALFVLALVALLLLPTRDWIVLIGTFILALIFLRLRRSR